MSNDTMQYKNLGHCGLKVSALGLGGWTTYGDIVTDASMVAKIIRGAYDAGVNFFDIADVYGNGEAELMMGKVLAEFPRHSLVISSKVFGAMSEEVNDRGLSRKHIMESIDKSLARIGTDYLDIYFCHRYDEETPLEETLRAMDDLIHRGKILYWGTSEWSGDQLRAANGLARELNLHAPQVEQPQLSLLARTRYETDVAPAIGETGMGVVVWSPLGSGMLTGKYDDGVPAGSRMDKIDWLVPAFRTPENVERVKTFKQIADELHCTRAQFALAWASASSGVTSVITGATRPEQFQENLGALKIEITDEIRTRLDRIFPQTQLPENPGGE